MELGLPVRRILTAGGEIVYAFRSEIDQWQATADLSGLAPSSALALGAGARDLLRGADDWDPELSVSRSPECWRAASGKDETADPSGADTATTLGMTGPTRGRASRYSSRPIFAPETVAPVE